MGSFSSRRLEAHREEGERNWPPGKPCRERRVGLHAFAAHWLPVLTLRLASQDQQCPQTGVRDAAGPVTLDERHIGCRIARTASRNGCAHGLASACACAMPRRPAVSVGRFTDQNTPSSGMSMRCAGHCQVERSGRGRQSHQPHASHMTWGSRERIASNPGLIAQLDNAPPTPSFQPVLRPLQEPAERFWDNPGIPPSEVIARRGGSRIRCDRYCRSHQHPQRECA